MLALLSKNESHTVLAGKVDKGSGGQYEKQPNASDAAQPHCSNVMLLRLFQCIQQKSSRLVDVLFVMCICSATLCCQISHSRMADDRLTKQMSVGQLVR